MFDILAMNSKQSYEQKTVFSSNNVGKIGHSHGQKMKRPTSHIIQKVIRDTLLV